MKIHKLIIRIYRRGPDFQSCFFYQYQKFIGWSITMFEIEQLPKITVFIYYQKNTVYFIYILQFANNKLFLLCTLWFFILLNPSSNTFPRSAHAFFCDSFDIYNYSSSIFDQLLPFTPPSVFRCVPNSVFKPSLIQPVWQCSLYKF